VRDTFRTAFEQFVTFGSGLVQAALVFFIAALIIRVLRRLVRRQLRRTLVPENVKRLVENLVTFVVLSWGATILLTHWGVTWSTLLTAIGLSTLVVALGLQSVLQCLIGGIFILFERPMSTGDRISYSVHRVGGTVEEIGWRTTVVRDDDGTRIVVPNSLALTNAVINHSPERAVLSIVTVRGAGGDGRTLPETRALAEAALADMPWPGKSPEIAVHATLYRLHLPRFVVRIPRLGTRGDQLVRDLIDETTQIRVTWYGVNDPGMREQVLQRLRDGFPTSRITVRRW
jgi:hypothetical protein